MANSFAEYKNQCFTENAFKLSPRNSLVRYHRNSHGNRKGVVLAYRDGDEVRVGVSLCHRSEKGGFNRHVGINKAMKSAVPIQTLATPLCIKKGIFRSATEWRKIPGSLRDEVKAMIVRAYKYFKDLPVRQINTDGEIELPEDESQYKAEAGIFPRNSAVNLSS
jgi:hypothetical protein